MNTPMLLEMAADGMADRLAVGGRHDDDGVTYAALLDRARRVAAVVAESGAERTILELSSSNRHEWTIFTNRFEPANTFPQFRDRRVFSLNSISVRRRSQLKKAPSCFRMASD